ncbi:MAG: 50S ribosomal protein L28, partial [Spirochaetota bacterium]
MAKCKVTGKGPLSGNNVSKANNHTKRWQRPNLHKKRVYVPELGRAVSLRVSSRGLRTITRSGLMEFLKKNNLQLKDVT